MEDPREQRSNKLAVYVGITVIVLLLILGLFLYLVRSPLLYKSSAYSSSNADIEPSGASALSLDNSYIFASPLRAKVGGEKVRITVFVLNTKGLGISGKKVTIGGGNLLSVTTVQSTTDGQGRATFDVASESSPGVYIIQAAVDGVNLVQQATVSFD